MKVLLAAGVVLALVAGGWALFIRSSGDHGHGITVGALEDAVKWPDVKTADERVADLEVIVTDTEVEALHLEQNLVKRHRPPFNTRLRDDKSFPYIA